MNTSVLYKTSEGVAAVMALYDAALARWPVPYEPRTIPTRIGETFAIASGDPHAPAMILLHGAGSNATVWAGDVQTYSAHYCVYAVDLPGEAGRSTSTRPDWNGPAFAEWLEDVLDGLGIQQAVLVGISQGGWTALKFAVAHPDRVAQLVLLAPAGVAPDRKSFLPRAIGYMLLGEWGIRRMTHALFADQPVPDGVVDIVVQVTRHFKPRVGVVPVFTDAELDRLTMPTLLIGGTKDIIRDTDKIAARLRHHLPHLSVTVIPGAGHALLDTTGHVTAFLSPLPADRQPVPVS